MHSALIDHHAGNPIGMVDSPLKRPLMQSLEILFVVTFNKLLKRVKKTVIWDILALIWCQGNKMLNSGMMDNWWYIYFCQYLKMNIHQFIKTPNFHYHWVLE